METIAALERWISDPLLASHALHGLGSLSRQLRDAGDQERAAAAVKPLLTQLRKASTDSSRIQVLRGIANSGYADAFDLVLPLVTDKNRDVRGAALEGLRHMHSEKVDPLLATRLKVETDTEVRLAALNAIKLRGCSAEITAALIGASNDAEVRVRLRAAALLGRCRGANPEVEAALKRLAATDPATTVREAATQPEGR